METVDWGYAIATLIIRFVGIFVVLGILQVIMQMTGRIFARLDARKQGRGSESPPSPDLTPEQVTKSQITNK
jgi:hypothetical protein